jgi:hypothetical protein
MTKYIVEMPEGFDPRRWMKTGQVMGEVCYALENAVEAVEVFNLDSANIYRGHSGYKQDGNPVTLFAAKIKGGK